MSMKLAFAMTVFICTVIYSKNRYVAIKTKLSAYQKLEEFAKNSFINLNGRFEDISSILSRSFDTPIQTNTSTEPWNALGFSDNECKEIMDYIINYNQLDITALRKASAKFSEYATALRQKREEEYKKTSPSLLCPPICALIAMILII